MVHGVSRFLQFQGVNNVLQFPFQFDSVKAMVRLGMIFITLKITFLEVKAASVEFTSVMDV